VIEAVTEKAQALVQLTNSKEGGKEVQETVDSINKRYEELVNNLLVTITQLEESLDVFQQFHDLQKSHQDYQKQLWDRLAGYSGKNISKLMS
jgi:nesprin-1